MMKQVFLLLICALALMLLSGCHVDHDPWETLSTGVPSAVPQSTDLPGLNG